MILSSSGNFTCLSTVIPGKETHPCSSGLVPPLTSPKPPSPFRVLLSVSQRSKDSLGAAIPLCLKWELVISAWWDYYKGVFSGPSQNKRTFLFPLSWWSQGEVEDLVFWSRVCGPSPLSLSPGESQFICAESCGPSLRSSVRQAQQGVHAMPMGREGPPAVFRGRQACQPVCPGVLQVGSFHLSAGGLNHQGVCYLLGECPAKLSGRIILLILVGNRRLCNQIDHSKAHNKWYLLLLCVFIIWHVLFLF